MARPGGANPGLVAKLEQERQLKAGITSHKTGLPKKLLELFEPLPPTEYKQPIRHRQAALPYTGFAALVEKFAAPGDPEYEPPPPEGLPEKRKVRNPEYPAQARLEKITKAERDDLKRDEKIKAAEKQLEERIKKWDPAKDSHIEGDPFKSLFVGRLSFDTTEKKLRREFEEFGPIKTISIVHNVKTGKPRGYAFIEYEHKNDMKNAYKMADGRKLEGKRVCVDVERGRTVPTWRPRRLGGGKGGESRVEREPKNPTKRAARGLPPLGPGGIPVRAPLSRDPVREPAREERRPEPRDREPRPEPRRRDEPLPAPPKEQWPVSSGADEKHREQDRGRERDRERDRPAREARDRSDREYVEKARSERERERDRDREKDRRGREPERSSGRSRERDRDAGEKDRGDRSERKRERDREAGELDGRDSRSSKRHRDEERHRDEDRHRSSSRRRERDL